MEKREEMNVAMPSEGLGPLSGAKPGLRAFYQVSGGQDFTARARNVRRTTGLGCIAFWVALKAGGPDWIRLEQQKLVLGMCKVKVEHYMSGGDWTGLQWWTCAVMEMHDDANTCFQVPEHARPKVIH